MFIGLKKLCIILFSLLLNVVSAETWVTLERVDVDRCASAWLIKRFIDGDPKFVFIEQGNESEAREGIGYDFFGAKYFHKGSDCTFTALIKAYGLSDNKALQKMNSDVNDVFSWRWRSGSFPVSFREHIAELRKTYDGDEQVYEKLYATFDLLYWSYGGNLGAFQFDSNELRETLFERSVVGFSEVDHAAMKEISEEPDSRWITFIEKSLRSDDESAIFAVQCAILKLHLEIIERRFQ